MTHSSAIKETPVSQVIFFLDGAIIAIQGNWQWNFFAENVLCSDVMFFPEISFADNLEFQQLVVKTLIHPDDREQVKDFITHLESNGHNTFSFRVITTAGGVETLTCNSVTEVKPLEDYKSLYVQQAEAAAEEKEQNTKRERQELRVKVYEMAERYTDAGTWAYNADTNEAFYSDQVYRLHGLSPQSLNAHLNTFSSFIHPEDRDIFADAFDKAFKEEAPLHLEYRIVRNDQQERYLQYISFWMYGLWGSRIVSGIIKDITEEKQLEKSLMLAEQALNYTQYNLQYTEQEAAVGNWTVNVYTRKTVYSDNVYRIHGLKPQSFMAGSSFFIDLVHPDDYSKVQEAHQRIFKEHVAPDLEYRIMRRNGDIRYLLQKGRVVINHEKEVIIAGIIKDITEERQQDTQLLALKNKLHLQNFTNNNVERITGIGHWMWDMESGDITWSDSLFLLLGLKPGFVGLTPKKMLSFIHPDDKYFFTTHMDQAYEHGAENEFLFRIMVKGSIRHMKASFKLLYQDAKKYLLGLLQDVTDQQLLQQHFNERVQFANQLSDTIKAQLFITNTDNTIILWNYQCEKHYGILKEDAVGQNVFDVLPHLKEPEIISVFERALRGETIQVPRVQGLNRQELFHHLAVPVKNELEDVTAVLHLWQDITQDIQLQEKLASGLQLIENLVENSEACIIVLDKNMNYQYWNAKSEAYFGLTKQEVLGKNILDVFPGFKTDPTYEDFKKALRGETVKLPVQQVVDKPGSYMQALLVPLKNEKGEVNAVLWMIQDVTSNTLLMRQQARADNLLQALHEAFLEIDLHWRVVYINDAALQFWNRSREEVMGKELLEAFPQIMHSPIYDAIINTIENKVTVRQEVSCPINGRWISSSVASFDEGVSIVFFDLQETKETREALKESKLFLEQVMNATPDFIMVINLLTKRVEFVNRSAYKDDQERYEETLQLDYEGILARAHPDDRQKLADYIESFRSATDLDIKVLEYRTVKGKEVIWYRSRGKVFKRNAEGIPTHYICNVQDITEQKLHTGK